MAVQEPPVATDDQLFELLANSVHMKETYTDERDWKEIYTHYVDLSVDEFFNEFFAADAPFGQIELGEQVKHKDFKVHQPWKKNSMVLHCNVPVQGVPFINQTRAVKTIDLRVRTPTQMVIEIDTKTLDAPYCDCFSCKEVWIVMSAREDEQRSILVKKQAIVFVKSTMFKSKIT